MLRRITNTQGTISNNTTLLGKVTTDTANTKVLIYSGSNDVAAVFKQARVSYVDSRYWIYVVGVNPFLARVIGMYKNADQNYSITLDKPFPGAAGASCAYILAPAAYSFSVDGGGTANVLNGDAKSGDALVPVNNGETVSEVRFIISGERKKLYPPVYIDATGTDVLISDEPI